MQPNRTAVDTVARGQAAAYRRVKHLVISKREGPAGSGPTYFVKTSAKQVYQFGEEEHLLCQLLDGKRSLPEIQAEFKRQIGADLGKEQFDGLVTELLECGIIEPNTGLQDTPGKPVEDAPPVPKSEPAVDFDDFEALADSADFATTARDPFAIRLPDPTVALEALDWLAGPLRYFRWMLLPTTLVCLILAALRTAAIGSDLSLLTPGRAIAMVAAALVIVDIVPTIAQAVMASFLGYTSQACGVNFRLGVVPGLCFSDGDWSELRTGNALRVTAAPFTARLTLFAVATVTWVCTRQDGGWLPQASLILGLVSLCAVLASAAPFTATSGRRWLTTLFGRTDLWRIGGFYRGHLLALSALWCLSLVGVLALLLSAAVHAGAFRAGVPGSGLLASSVPAFRPVLAKIALPATLGPSLGPILDSITLPLLTILPIATWIWLRGTVNSHGVARVLFLPQYDVPTGFAPDVKGPRTVIPFDRDGQSVTPARKREETPWRPTKTLIFFATLLALLLAFGFVPYPYEAGGNFTILPHDASQMNARVAGELTEVLVNEGDWVSPGQILGILSDWDQQANLSVSKAQLENAKGTLQALYETPKPEDVELARKQYELAVSKLPYDKAQYERAAYLVKTDAVSHQNYDQILSQYQQDQAASEVARSNYDDVRAGPTPGQLDAARALVRQYAATVAYNEDQLERTRIRATSYGTVVTPNPMLLRGQWFAQGQLVFTVQDLRTVQADVQIPETDIGHVALNGVVRLRPWGYPETTFPGTSMAIAGDAQPDPGGSGSNIIRVRAELPNPDGALHPNMTGYAKVSGVYMPAWKAFVQMLIRFFQITIWSFVP